MGRHVATKGYKMCQCYFLFNNITSFLTVLQG